MDFKKVIFTLLASVYDPHVVLIQVVCDVLCTSCDVLQLNSDNKAIVHTELIDEDGESRYKITDIIGILITTQYLLYCTVHRNEAWTWSRKSFRFGYDSRGDFTSLSRHFHYQLGMIYHPLIITSSSFH